MINESIFGDGGSDASTAAIAATNPATGLFGMRTGDGRAAPRSGYLKAAPERFGRLQSTSKAALTERK